MADMMEDMDAAVGGELDPEDLETLMDMDMDPYSDGFEDALDLDPDCEEAHMGMALVGLFMMAQDDDLAELMEDFEQEFGGTELPIGPPLAGMATRSLFEGGILGRSFAIMHRAPLVMTPQELQLVGPQADKADGPLLRELQTHIHDHMLPRVATIISHLAHVESHPDFQMLVTFGDEVDPEMIEIDLGEVYVLDAVMRALRTGLLVATAYDIEIAPDGDYSWITDNMGYIGYNDYEVVTGTAAGDTLYLYDDEYVDVQQAAAVYGEIANLLAPGSDFLTLWTDPWSGEDAMQAAYDEGFLLLGKLEAAYEFIQDETDPQDNDVIEQLLIAELDEAILEMGADLPEWIGTFETLPDVIAWIEEIFSGPYTIPVPMGEDTTFDLTVDISALFVDPVDDWKTKLPYMTWLPIEEWAVFDEHYVGGPYYWNPDQPYNAYVDGEDVVYTNIVSYYYVEDDWDMDMPFAFLDGPDGEIIDGGFPHFPDYTMGGLFPTMDREDWLTLLGITE
jgi:hypothetical protein